jgi:predicted DNA-binding transcriptional regulator YafY
MTDALLRQWTLLTLIPRAPQKTDAGQLRARLADAGYAITRRQLQRDLNTLSILFPITADDRSIPYGWSWTQDAPAFDLPRLDGPSALALKLLEQFHRQLLPPTLTDQLAPQFRRADQVLAAHDPRHLGVWLDRVRVIPNSMPLLPPAVDDASARTVYQCLLEGTRFSAVYTARGAAPRELVVSPLGLVAKGPVLYLVCTLCDFSDLRQLAMHRIDAATATDTPVSVPPGFDLDRYIAEGEFHYPVGPEIELKACFHHGAAAHLHETPLSADQTITDVDAEHVLVTATVHDTEQLRWWLLGFGELVEVRAPAALRAELATALRRCADNYQAVQEA